MKKYTTEEHNMAAAILSILDSIKMTDNDLLSMLPNKNIEDMMLGETLSEMIFRKLKGYDVDINDILEFDHLAPVVFKTTKTHKVKIHHKYCDICGIEIKNNMSYENVICETCGKDLCNTCVDHEVNTKSDYREVYCKECWDIGTKYRKDIDEHEAQIEKLENEWYELCKNSK